MWCVRSLYIVYKKHIGKVYTGFSLLWRWGCPTTNQKFAHSTPPHQIFIPSPQKSIQPNKKNISFLAVVTAPVPFFVLILYSFETRSKLVYFDFNWCSVFTKCGKIFESSLLLRFLPPGNKNPPSSLHYFLTQSQVLCFLFNIKRKGAVKTPVSFK